MTDKTAEQAAEEWANDEGKLWTADISVYTEGHKDAIRQAFQAGYSRGKADCLRESKEYGLAGALLSDVELVSLHEYKRREAASRLAELEAAKQSGKAEERQRIWDALQEGGAGVSTIKQIIFGGGDD